MGIPFGVGQGLAQGVQTVAPMFMQAMQRKQQQGQFDKAMDADIEWKRGLAQLGPSYLDQEAQANPNTMPAIPSAGNMDQPSQVGRLAVPGQAISQPPAPARMPTASPQASGVGMSPAEMLAMPRPSMAMRMARPRTRY